jgi:hypothetical protein
MRRRSAPYVRWPAEKSLPAGSQRADLGACPHDAKNGIARDHSNDMRSVVFGAAYHRHLIHVGGQQAFQQAQQWLFWRSPQNFIARNHHRLHRHVRPLLAPDGIQCVDIHHADEALVGDH